MTCVYGWGYTAFEGSIPTIRPGKWTVKARVPFVLSLSLAFMQTRPNMHRANSPSPCTSILEFNRCRDVPPRIAPRYSELFVRSNHFVICGLIFVSRRKWKSKMKTDARKNSDIDSTSFSPWPLFKRLVKSMRIDTNRKIWYPMDQLG